MKSPTRFSKRLVRAVLLLLAVACSTGGGRAFQRQDHVFSASDTPSSERARPTTLSSLADSRYEQTTTRQRRQPPRGLSPAVAALRDDLNRIVGSPGLDRATWGISVKSLTSGQTLYEMNSRKLLIPASVLKVGTLAAAADRLGWDYTYETTILAIGAVDFGFLDGDLVVVGSGDPSITDRDGSATRLFQIWADRLKNLGIRSVGGNLVGDDNTLEDPLPGPGWAWDDLDKGYATGIGALQFNENAVRLTIAPGPGVGVPATLTMSHPGSGLIVQNDITTTASDARPLVTSRRLGGTARLELRGTMPLGSAPIVRTVSVENPTLHFVSTLKDALVANGIEVRGAAVDIDELAHPPRREDGVPVVMHRSPPLANLAVRMMKISQNLYAESLLNTLKPFAAPDDRGALPSLIASWGVETGDLLTVDGSGLSRYNLVTAQALVTILAHVDADERLRDPFLASLPEAGKDGTLALRLKGTPAEGNARAKTGSLANVRTLAGYVRAADGQRLAFAILANHYGTTADAVEHATDAIVVKLSEFGRR